MKYVAEITLRTEPFEAEDADEARKVAQRLSWTLEVDSDLIEVAVTELTEMDQ